MRLLECRSATVAGARLSPCRHPEAKGDADNDDDDDGDDDPSKRCRVLKVWQ